MTLECMKPARTHEPELWIRYRRDRDTAARDWLFAIYAPWAADIAAGLHRRLYHSRVDKADCVQNASIGLLEAISRFEPERGIPFAAFALPRVRGAVLTGLRTSRAHGMEAHERSFGEILEQLAAHEHADPFDAIVDAIAHLSIGCLLESTMGNVIDAEDGFNYARSAQIENGIRAAVETLPERDRRIIVDHYYGHLPFSEIAVGLGLTRGRVSQLHHAALAKIRSALREF